MKRLFITLGLFAIGCTQPEEVELPQSPDMETLVRAYETLDPIAGLSEGDVITLLEAQQSRLDAFCGVATDAENCAVLGIAQNLVDTIALDAFQTTSQPLEPMPNALVIGGQNFDAEGYFRLHRVCQGESDEVDEAKNGAIRLTGTFSEERLDPVIWGELQACRTIIPGQADLWNLDGDIDLYTELPPFADLADITADDLLQRLVLRVIGDLGPDDAVVSIADDIALDAAQNIRLRVSDPDLGAFVLVLGADGIALQGSDGRWTCDIDIACDKELE